MDTINIIGAGLAGLMAAINLAKHNIKSNLISNMPSERAQSVLAEGGINACLNLMGEDDKIEYHAADTKRGGCNIESDESINNLVNIAPRIIDYLIKIGVPFQKENGKLIERNFGGQSKKRTAYAKSSTGKIIMTALIDEARKYEALGLIKRYSHHECIDVLVSDKRIDGIIINDTFNRKTFKLAGVTILAIGGLNGFFEGHITGSIMNNGNLQANLFKKGVEFRNLEFIQYHPTTIDIGFKRLLVSEAARGEGARLFIYKDNKQYYFMDDIHPLKSLAPRDVISRSEYLISKKYNTDIYLDFSNVKKEVWENKLPDLRQEIINYTNLDPKTNHIKVSPGIHYFMGGIKVNKNHKTNITGLYAIGECASIYHGANRLGGNSMLGAITGGIISSNDIINSNLNIKNELEEVSYVEQTYNPKYLKLLTAILIDSLSIVRDETNLIKGIKKIDEIILSNNLNEFELNKFLLAKAMILSANERKESRGAHYRLDYKEENDKFKKISVSKYINNEIKISFEEDI
ncbi:MAG: FAD-binding protein [Acholeplasmatales bacterium]|nr:FAD-binding protein [Acholeplasmatales bacterium]